MFVNEFAQQVFGFSTQKSIKSLRSPAKPNIYQYF